MSGHSKWSTIKRQKGVTDARRSAVFTKHARLISIATRAGGKDPAMNFRLRLEIDRARAANMPNDNIERAIKAGAGELRGDQVKEAVYEGFGPGGTAIMVNALTDNPNRTSADIRTLLSKRGGSLGGHNSVAWMFALRGVLRIPTAAVPADDRDEFSLAAVEAGADDLYSDAASITILTPPEALPSVSAWLTAKRLAPEEAGLEFVPQTTVALDDRQREALHDLLTALDEHDDVTGVFCNAE